MKQLSLKRLYEEVGTGSADKLVETLNDPNYSQVRKMIEADRILARQSDRHISESWYEVKPRATRREPTDTDYDIDKLLEMMRPKSLPSRQKSVFAWFETTSFNLTPSGFIILPKNGFKLWQHKTIRDFTESELYEKMMDNLEEGRKTENFPLAKKAYWGNGVTNWNQMKSGKEVFWENTKGYIAIKVMNLSRNATKKSGGVAVHYLNK